MVAHQDGVRGCQAPHLAAHHPGGRKGEIIRTDTRIPVPVIEDPLLILSSDPDNLDAHRRKPEGQTSTPVPVVGLALDIVEELDKLDGVRHGRIFELSRQRGTLGLERGTPTSHFFVIWGKVLKTNSPGSSKPS